MAAFRIAIDGASFEAMNHAAGDGASFEAIFTNFRPSLQARRPA